jgi:hypothetical protein
MAGADKWAEGGYQMSKATSQLAITTICNYLDRMAEQQQAEVICQVILRQFPDDAPQGLTKQANTTKTTEPAGR